MPLITGALTSAGPLVDVLVAADPIRRRILRRLGAPAPEPVPVRVLVDTGSFQSGFAPSVFARLGLRPVDTTSILTPSTPPDAPHVCNVFVIALLLIADGTAHPFTNLRAIATDGWLPGEAVEGLIGRDVLDHCTFEYFGVQQRFQLSF